MSGWRRAERPIVEAKNATCCYAQSDKQWIADPQGVPWETFYTYGESTVYGEGSLAKLKEVSEAACCAPSCCEPEAIQAAGTGRRDGLLRPLRGGDMDQEHKKNWCGRAMAGSPKRRARRAAARRRQPAAARLPIRCSKSREMGYSDAELAAVPDGANLGLGCGNPQAIAALKPGETVIDLGSGAGFDCFLAPARSARPGM